MVLNGDSGVRFVVAGVWAMSYIQWPDPSRSGGFGAAGRRVSNSVAHCDVYSVVVA